MGGHMGTCISLKATYRNAHDVSQYILYHDTYLYREVVGNIPPWSEDRGHEDVSVLLPYVPAAAVKSTVSSKQLKGRLTVWAAGRTWSSVSRTSLRSRCHSAVCRWWQIHSDTRGTESFYRTDGVPPFTHGRVLKETKIWAAAWLGAGVSICPRSSVCTHTHTHIPGEWLESLLQRTCSFLAIKLVSVLLAGIFFLEPDV